MARRNLLRSLLAASLSLVPFAATLLVVPAPAGGAEGEDRKPQTFGIRLSEKSGFTPGVLDDQHSVQVGDFIAFYLDPEQSTSNNHSVTFDDTSSCPGGYEGRCWPELRFNDDQQPPCTWRGIELPNYRCIEVRVAGPVRYYDRLYLEAGGPEFQGFIKVQGVPPTTTTTAAPTTTTTAAAPTTTTTRPGTTTTTRPGTTTTTLPPTTNTTAPTTIRPFVISDPTTTTTAAPAAGAPAAGSGKNGGGTTAPAAKDKDKGKGKADPETTATTAPPAAAQVPEISLSFDAVTLPDSAGAPGAADGAEIESAAVMDLLNSEEEPADEGDSFALVAMGAAGLLVFGAVLLAWFRRSSRYFPA